MKEYCIEIILTTLLDVKPTFETTEEWDEDVFVEKLNVMLEPLNMRIFWDPKYDWEDETGKSPLMVYLETIDHKFIDSESHNFPDPTQFDQVDLIEPINRLLGRKGFKCVDASYFLDAEVASYCWVLLPKEEAEQTVKKYGAFSEWYQYFPDSGEEGEEGAEEEEEGEPEPPKKAVAAKQPPQKQIQQQQPQKQQQTPKKR